MTQPDETQATRHCLTLEVEVAAPLAFEPTITGTRRCIPLLAGRFWGDLEGRIVPGGTDWQTVLPDGNIELSAHYALETSAGELIEVTSVGVRNGTPDVLARLARGEPVPTSEYYFRTHLRLRSASARLQQLNLRLYCGRGERQKSLVRINVFELL
jgi:hypothetical protein